MSAPVVSDTPVEDTPTSSAASPNGGAPRRGHRLGLLVGVLAAAGLLLAAVISPVVLGTGLAAKSSANYFNDLPDELTSPILGRDSRMLAADGSVLAVMHDPQNRVPVTIAQIPQVMQTSIIDIEDSRFYEHHGVDSKGLARAALRNSEAGGVQQGGSTITQQYVKNVLLSQATTADEQQQAREQTVGRKLREARLALAVETKLSKPQILEGYLDLAYFGNGAYGVGAAARRYFGIQVQQLSLTQAALLAGVVNSPSQFDPLRYPQAALDRRNAVLTRMQDLGHITPAQASAARSSPLALSPVAPPPVGDSCYGTVAPFYCDYVRNSLHNDPALGATPAERDRKINSGGLTIRTTLDPNVQRAAQNAVDNAASHSDEVAATQVVVRPGTGEVLAMAVSRDYGTGPGQTTLPLPTTATFQPGSSFKTFTLAAALAKGLPVSTSFYAPACYVSPIYVIGAGSGRTGGGGCSDGFSNAEPDEAKTYSIPEATWKSVNTFYIQLEEKVGIPAVVEMAERLGIPPDRLADVGANDGALTLGTPVVSPLSMASAYATLAASGNRCDPKYIASATDGSGRPLAVNKTSCRQVLDPAVADQVTGILEGVITQGTGAQNAPIGQTAAGKTGTTEGFSSAWFVGYTRELSSAVEVGDPRGPTGNPLKNRTIGGQTYGEMFGGDLPARTWSRMMRSALASVPSSNESMPPAVGGGSGSSSQASGTSGNGSFGNGSFGNGSFGNGTSTGTGTSGTGTRTRRSSRP